MDHLLASIKTHLPDWLQQHSAEFEHLVKTNITRWMDILHVWIHEYIGNQTGITFIAIVTLVVSLAIFLGLGFVSGAIGGRFSNVDVPAPPEADLEWSGQPLSNPSIHHPTDKQIIICYDPATGQKLGERRAMTPTEILETVARARQAQREYAKTTFKKRRAILTTLLDWVVENQELVCRVTARDSGKTIVDASFGELLTTCEKLRWTIANGETVLAPEYRGGGGLVVAHKSARVEYTPIGVMGCIVSWNYPCHNVLGPIISALMAGNACVVKASEHVAWSSAYWQSIVRTVLRKHGIDDALVAIVNGWSDAGEALIGCADKITFIGSPGVGKLVMRKASETITPVVLELGGKDAAVICEDCDFDQVVQIAMRGTFQNCGQNCIGLERLVVHAKIYDKFVNEMERRISGLIQGPPLSSTKAVDCGAMTMSQASKNIQHLVDDAVKSGARLLVGGKPYKCPSYPSGQYFTPTLLVDVTPDMKIAKEEVFGPVAVVMKFKNDADAIRIVNACPFGLGSSVFTLNYSRGEKIAAALRTGMANVNDFGINYLCQSLPFGGVGISGIDRFAGVEGLRGNCHIRAITSDYYRYFGVRTGIPPLLQYPLSKTSDEFQKGLVEFLYGAGLSGKLRGIFGLLGAMVTGKAST
ncbi:hypothetical protein SmJEL517_g00308 [Synchytrium microbalum]|uniref:Aldehyde dehydrogenase domain-containing protein n=1 Tax=Synchytrium microbalum TaxID=1806994 RepID=A0A507C9Q9_9FUNG|nr:uncharacterized protein SmJEL517_g00308 [Synchytrium microbalum]TPX38320.1 hypothetical protein SmJEL517_g00308 [Synchytrium microbalum]